MFHQEYINPSKLIVNEDILKLFNIVEKHGGVLRFVGGAVRDAIADIERSNIDLVTDLSPSEFSDMCDDEGLRCIPIGIQFFTIGVMVNSSFFKITSLSNEDDNIKDEWMLDASKRDLTINAVYADDKGNVFDYYNGIKDLEEGVIKFIGKPEDAIEYDYIRIMRFFRFCAMFGKKIDRKSLKACIKNKKLLKKISIDKIREELFKIIMAPYAVRALELIFDNGILDFLIAKPKNLNNMDKLNKIVNDLNLDKNIIRRIFVIFEPDVKRANRLADIFRLNRNQKDYLINLCNSKLTKEDFKDSVSITKSIYKYGVDICRDVWLFINLDNENKNQIIEVLNIINSIKISPFPITGKDLIKLGADTKLVGLHLDILKKEWYDSGCLLTKDELIDKYNNNVNKLFVCKKNK
ncbi:MAG: CCA tRNA nucleotidyltransferase [Alphaproteobacteria bacterium]|nr:CCA tRNA nucleotidyltransferase [Alphaproteobacteria bacterium]